MGIASTTNQILKRDLTGARAAIYKYYYGISWWRVLKLIVYGKSERSGPGKILGVAEARLLFPILADDVPQFSRQNVLSTSGALEK